MPAQTPAPELITMENNRLAVSLDARTGPSLAALVDTLTGRNFIAPGGSPLFRLVLARQGTEPVTFTSLDCAGFQIERATAGREETLTLRFGPPSKLDVRVTCRVTLEADSALSFWRISVDNRTDYGVRSLYYPIVIAPPILGESEEDDRYVDATFGGRSIERPTRQGRPRVGLRPASEDSWLPTHQYPGLVSAQFQAYYDQTAGLYQAAYDSTGAIKEFGFYALDGNFDLTIVHHYDERPGLSFELPYPVALGVFHGDWHAAADLYKAWARNQHWCARKLVERDDIPVWLKEPRPCLMVISQGDVERARGTLNYPPAEYPLGRVWPARKAVALVGEFKRIFKTPVIVWMEGWEKIGAPGGPAEIFPPLEGEASYRAAMQEFERDEIPVLMYLAGFHWTYKRPMTGYEDWDAFLREGRAMAVEDPHGGLLISNNATRTYLDGQKHFVSLCVGSQETQELFLKNFMKLMDLGAVAVQNDQQLGFYADVCYSHNHDHAPGYGPWMYVKTLEFIRKSRQAIKARNPAGTLDVEAPCEIWIQEIDFFLDRPYFYNAIPLFQYLYHEYTAAYGGDDFMALCHRECAQMMQAKILTLGIRNIVVANQPDYDFEVNPAYPVLALVRNVSRAQRTFARDYVVFGEMLPPVQVEVEQVMVDIYRSQEQVPVPKVYHSTWKTPQGKIGTVLANWTNTPQKVCLRLEQGAGPVYRVDEGDRTALAPQSGGGWVVETPPVGVVLVEHGRQAGDH